MSQESDVALKWPIVLKAIGATTVFGIVLGISELWLVGPSSVGFVRACVVGIAFSWVFFLIGFIFCRRGGVVLPMVAVAAGGAAAGVAWWAVSRSGGSPAFAAGVGAGLAELWWLWSWLWSPGTGKSAT